MKKNLPLSVEKASSLGGVVNAALDCWGLNGGKVDLIKQRENAIYKVTDVDGACSVLRIHRRGYHDEESLLSEHQWMGALSAAGIRTPAVIAALDGVSFQSISSGNAEVPYLCDMLGWVSGTPLGSVEDILAGEGAHMGATYRSLGEIAAQIHNHGTKWVRPSGFSRQAWDLDGLTGDDPNFGKFWESKYLTSEQRELVLFARENIRAELLSFGYADDRFGLIHADFVPENIFIDQDGIAIIDFDDAGFGWHLYEFSVALYFFLGQDSYQPMFEAMVEGYRQHRPLPNEHLKMMPCFMAIRSLTLLGWLQTRSGSDEMEALIPTFLPSVMQLLDGYLGRTTL